ncbi:MAG: hypothetical protein IJW30_06680 [Clostridia bacterium]|nr:hypothetical protein [Clostridia bacterium]MBQ9774334.1 hypothetical protein [Clostridia bacterium]
MKGICTKGLLLLLALLLATASLYGCDDKAKDDENESTYGTYYDTDYSSGTAPGDCYHDWQSAECPSGTPYCSMCYENYWSSQHDWDYTNNPCVGTCTACGETEEDYSWRHIWDYTNNPCIATCKDCGATEGEPKHDWLAATCTTPKTCKDCGATEGEVSDEHDWLAATCTTPKTCKDCGATEGEKSEHNWVAATCTTAERCKDCGEKGDEAALGHYWNYAKGTCDHEGCEETTDAPFILFPETPISVTYTGYSETRRCKITSFRYEWSWKLSVYWDAEKTYDTEGNNYSSACTIGYKRYDLDGYVVDSGTDYSVAICVGEKVKDQVFYIYDLDPHRQYRLVILDVD